MRKSIMRKNAYGQWEVYGSRKATKPYIIAKRPERAIRVLIDKDPYLRMAEKARLKGKVKVIRGDFHIANHVVNRWPSKFKLVASDETVWGHLHYVG